MEFNKTGMLTYGVGKRKKWPENRWANWQKKHETNLKHIREFLAGELTALIREAISCHGKPALSCFGNRVIEGFQFYAKCFVFLSRIYPQHGVHWGLRNM